MLSTVTMPMAEGVWLQFAVQVFGGAVSTPVGGGERMSGRMGPEWVPKVPVRQPYSPYQTVFR